MHCDKSWTPYDWFICVRKTGGVRWARWQGFVQDFEGAPFDNGKGGSTDREYATGLTANGVRRQLVKRLRQRGMLI